MRIREGANELLKSIFDAVKQKLAPFDLSAVRAAVRKKTDLQYRIEPQCDRALRVLIDSINAEAGLNLFGQMAAREHLSDLLVTSLRLFEYWRQTPAIQAQTVLPPLFITGTPKSGSTFLHRLLARDPLNRAPRTWEVMFPVPPPARETFDSDPRIRKTEQRLRLMRWTRPSLTKAHPIGARLPQECGEILAYSLQSYVFLDMFLIPSYETWLSTLDMAWPYEFHMRMLKHLQWQCPGERWVLKSSDHIYALSTILKTYSDARVIFLHRDPTKVLQASASQATILKSLFSSSIDPVQLAADEVRALTDKVNKIMAFRNNATHLSDCFIDVCYLELANNPMATVHAIRPFRITFVPECRDAYGSLHKSRTQQQKARQILALRILPFYPHQVSTPLF